MFKSSLFLIVAIVMAFIGNADAKTKGFATATTVPDFASNTCKVAQADLDGLFYGSVSQDLWENGSVCGKCIRVRGILGRSLTKTYLVKVVDFCTNCSSNDLTLSSEALTAVQGPGGKNRIEWEWASCTSGREALDSSTGRADKKSSKSRAGRKILTTN